MIPSMDLYNNQKVHLWTWQLDKSQYSIGVDNRLSTPSGREWIGLKIIRVGVPQQPFHGQLLIGNWKET